MTVTAGVASIKGTYAGKVALTDLDSPRSFVLRASGAGGPGTVSTDVAVALADAGDGSTTLTYDADAVVGGVIAGVGQRMLTGVSKKMAGEFFQAVDDVLTGKAVAVAAGGRWRPSRASSPQPAARRVSARSRAGSPAAGSSPGRSSALPSPSPALSSAACSDVGCADEPLPVSACAVIPVRVAAVQVAPSHEPLSAESIAGNAKRATELVRACVDGDRRRSWSYCPRRRRPASPPGCRSRRSGTWSAKFRDRSSIRTRAVAAELGIHLVVGSYERGPVRGQVFNAAALIGPSG